MEVHWILIWICLPILADTINKIMKKIKIDLIFLFKEEKSYKKYLTEKLCYSEIHAKEFIDYEKNIIEDLYSK